MNDGFVDLWHGDILSLEGESDILPEQKYWSYLDDDERKKAQSFVRLDLQKMYIKTRGELRQLLSSYLDIEPQKINIKTGEYGKPFLADDLVYFNLSHSGNQFVVVVSNLGDVGVDLERCGDRKGMSRLADKCFSDLECDYWHALSEQQRKAMFYRFWVRKEAFVKAVGRGIALGLDQCIVNPEDQDQFLKIPVEYGQPSSWRIIDVPLDEAVSCAVVIKNKPFKYQQTRFNKLAK